MYVTGDMSTEVSAVQSRNASVASDTWKSAMAMSPEQQAELGSVLVRHPVVRVSATVSSNSTPITRSMTDMTPSLTHSLTQSLKS